jgi:hypothetical protein
VHRDVRDIAAWFIDTDYNEESFFVRHAYFLGANDPYKALKTALRAEINEEAWSTLYSSTSRSFRRPRDGAISRPDLTAAAREANEAGFDMLIACAFNFDAHSSELHRLGPLPILKARMNPPSP